MVMESEGPANPTSTKEEEEGHRPSSSTPSEVPPFTPTHPLRDRSLSFTEFLLSNLSEWSKPHPPLLRLPPIAFSGSDRAIKGRLPHRTIAISASLSSLIGDRDPLSDAWIHGDAHAAHGDTCAETNGGRHGDDTHAEMPCAETHGGNHAAAVVVDDDSPSQNASSILHPLVKHTTAPLHVASPLELPDQPDNMASLILSEHRSSSELGPCSVTVPRAHPLPETAACSILSQHHSSPDLGSLSLSVSKVHTVLDVSASSIASKHPSASKAGPLFLTAPEGHASHSSSDDMASLNVSEHCSSSKSGLSSVPSVAISSASLEPHSSFELPPLSISAPQEHPQHDLPDVPASLILVDDHHLDPPFPKPSGTHPSEESCDVVASSTLFEHHEKAFTAPLSGSDPSHELPDVGAHEISVESGDGRAPYRAFVPSLVMPGSEESHSFASAPGGKTSCSTPLATSQSCLSIGIQPDCSIHSSSSKVVVDVYACGTDDTSVIDTHCAHEGAVVPPHEVASGAFTGDKNSEPAHTLPLECGNTVLPTFTSVTNGGPELSLHSPTRKDNLLRNETENTMQNTNVDVPDTHGLDEKEDDLEEGELSEKWADDECPDTIKETSDKKEAEMREKGPLDVFEQQSLRTSEPSTDDEMDMPIGFFLSRYFTRSSLKKEDAQVSGKKRQLTGTNGESKKKKKSRKKRKTEKQEQTAPSKVASADAGGTGKARQVKGLQKGSSKVATAGARDTGKGGQQLDMQRGLNSMNVGNAGKGGGKLGVQKGMKQLVVGSQVESIKERADVKENQEGALSTPIELLGDAGQLGVQNVKKKLGVASNAESVKERADTKEKQEGALGTSIKGMAQHDRAGSEQVLIPEKKKGLLSMAVEEEVGLWTTEAGDNHVLTSQEELLPTLLRCLDPNLPMLFNAVNNVGKHLGGQGKKPKRTLTAERKKKRQQAKHRKRSQKEEVLGIRKLRLKPPVRKKEKVITFCQFYIKGKCSKGASCTFSHDVVPRTKSEVCKYFINRCCLKGDDCPFSHALSSFPCKFFHTRGYCLDADTCRFSHEPISEETRHELQRKIEQEQQVRQGNVVTSSDVMSGKIASIDVSPRLLESQNHMPLFDPKVFPLRGKPADNKVEGSVKGKDAEGRNPSLSRDVKEGSAAGIGNAENGFTRTEGSDNNAMLLAARKAASAFTFGSSNAMNSGVNRSLLHGGLLGATGSPLNRTTVLDASTPSGLVRKENPGQPETPGAAFIMGLPGNSTWTQDPKARAMEILQASLGASQLMSRSKSATGMEDVQGFDTLFGRLKLLPTVQNTLLEPPGISTPRDPKARAMEILQVSLGSSQPPISRLKSTADTQNIPDFGSPADRWKSDSKGSEPPVLASTLLDQVSKSKEAAVPEPSVSTSNLLSNILRANSDVASSPNKRPTVDSLLSKILKG